MATSSRDRRQADRAYIRELSERVAAWDPIGLIGNGGSSEEYDCLLAPLVAALRDGLMPSELATLLRERVRDHFGMEPAEPDHFAADVTAWHRGHRSN